MTLEKWKDIKGTNGMYQISSKGRVKGLPRTVMRKDGIRGSALKERILKGAQNSSGYITVTLPQGSFFVHRLVAEAFIDNPLDKEQVNHKDGDKFNNSVSNLEWMSPKENSRHGFALEVNKMLNVGSKNPSSKLNENQVVEIKMLLQSGKTSKELSEEYGVSYGCIRAIKVGESWAHVNIGNISATG